MLHLIPTTDDRTAPTLAFQLVEVSRERMGAIQVAITNTRNNVALVRILITLLVLATKLLKTTTIRLGTLGCASDSLVDDRTDFVTCSVLSQVHTGITTSCDLSTPASNLRISTHGRSLTSFGSRVHRFNNPDTHNDVDRTRKLCDVAVA